MPLISLANDINYYQFWLIKTSLGEKNRILIKLFTCMLVHEHINWIAFVNYMSSKDMGWDETYITEQGKTSRGFHSVFLQLHLCHYWQQISVSLKEVSRSKHAFEASKRWSDVMLRSNLPLGTWRVFSLMPLLSPTLRWISSTWHKKRRIFEVLIFLQNSFHTFGSTICWVANLQSVT